MKNTLRGLLGFLGNKFPWIIKLILMLTYPFPRWFIAVAQWGGLSQAVTQRTWHIHSGPLRGYWLADLLLMEIAPVLANRVEIHCSDLLSRLNLKSATVFDVGGSYGYYALLLARLVGGGAYLVLSQIGAVMGD